MVSAADGRTISRFDSEERTAKFRSTVRLAQPTPRVDHVKVRSLFPKGKPRGRAFAKKITGDGAAKNPQERLERLLSGVN
jgi:hypothetical protein